MFQRARVRKKVSEHSNKGGNKGEGLTAAIASSALKNLSKLNFLKNLKNLSSLRTLSS